MKTRILVASFALAFAAMPAEAELIRPIRFPVDGPASFTDTFNDGRSGGRSHEGIDIMADKMVPVVAAVDGRVHWMTETEQSYGWMVVLEDAEGYEYHYIHLNNDTPGTDDGAGGREHAIAPGIERGASVAKGQLVGWVGDSGNAETVAPHLHFEIHLPGGIAANPYYSLLAAERPGAFHPADVRLAVTSIDVDKDIQATTGASPCVAGARIRSVSSPAVYYCGADGKRYVFPNEKVYTSWYPDFSGVTTISDEAMASAMLGGNVTYKPGVKLVKITTDPKVYAVDRGGVLRHVATPELAAQLYGATWAKQVDDIPDAFFINYKIGDPVTTAE
ncbi:MAG TPA: M23 family metallopeptidase [Patescibacteria group bacterium]|nr:M23 family metallopeptidase [Patescibacteria group bacterium]